MTPCSKCGKTERYKNGKCGPCRRTKTSGNIPKIKPKTEGAYFTNKAYKRAFLGLEVHPNSILGKLYAEGKKAEIRALLQHLQDDKQNTRLYAIDMKKAGAAVFGGRE